MRTKTLTSNSSIEQPLALELADGTRLVADSKVAPARVEGDRDHAFTLADVQRQGGQPFAGYHLEK
jgi:hypothetical protein